jgi:S-adenosylmethionine:tRNA ribosyltransferase-isomerase
MAAAGVIDTFSLPDHLEAAEPPEARGLNRDQVRLLVSNVATDAIDHAHFSDLPHWLSPGDLLVVNTSGTLNAALDARAESGESIELHLSTQMPGNFWVVEARRRAANGSSPYDDALAGTRLQLESGGWATLLAPYPLAASLAAHSRLWLAALELDEPVLSYLERSGKPIRYRYVRSAWPSSMYQTVFATEPGSAEMPSAARPFTAELVTRLVSHGVQIAPLLLHTGVASLEKHEPPYEEYFRVPSDTADRINAARRRGHRVIAVGTTVVRALETVTDHRGTTSPGEGWTNLVITPERALQAVTGLITGLHEPRATHLAIVTQVLAAAGSSAPSAHLDRAYSEALDAGYLWHEFGDSHLIVGHASDAVTAPGTPAALRSTR